MPSKPPETEVRTYAQVTETKSIEVDRQSQGTPDVHRPSIARRHQEDQSPVRRPRSDSQASQETSDEFQNFRLLSRHDTWTAVNDGQLRLNRNYSATLLFHRQVDLSAADIISALSARDFTSDSVKALQRSSPGIYIITFHDIPDKEAFLQLTNFKVNGFAPLLQDSTAPLTFVNIRNAPPELPDAAIIARLECYGDVVTFRRCTHYDSNIENGIRTARMRLRSPIPSYVRIASESLLILYANQPRTCRKCNLTGHEARTCSTFACFNCDAVGHLASSCSQRTRCSICKSSAHKAHSCPYAIIDDLDTSLPISTVLAEALSAAVALPTSAATSDNDQEEQEEHNITDAQSLAAKPPAPTTSDTSSASTVKSFDPSLFKFNTGSDSSRVPFASPPKQPPKQPPIPVPVLKTPVLQLSKIPKPMSKPPAVPCLPPKPVVEDEKDDKMSVCSASSKRGRPDDPDTDEDEELVSGGARRKTKPKRPYAGKPKPPDWQKRR